MVSVGRVGTGYSSPDNGVDGGGPVLISANAEGRRAADVFPSAPFPQGVDGRRFGEANHFVVASSRHDADWYDANRSKVDSLRVLADFGDDAAIASLKEWARTHYTVVTVLWNLANKGNKAAAEAMKTLDASVLIDIADREYDGYLEPLKALGDLAEKGNEAAYAALVRFARTKGDTDFGAEGILGKLSLAGNEAAFEELSGLARKDLGAVATLYGLARWKRNERAKNTLQTLDVSQFRKAADTTDEVAMDRAVLALKHCAEMGNGAALVAIAEKAKAHYGAVYALIVLARTDVSAADHAKKLNVSYFARRAGVPGGDETESSMNVLQHLAVLGNRAASEAVSKLDKK